MVLFVGQIERGARGREAFQEVDYRAAFGPLAKWATEVDDARRLPEIVARAFSVACSGRPGPVVVALPEDMLTERAEVSDARALQPIESAPSPAQMAQLLERLRQARNPVAIVGGSRWNAEAVARFQDFAAAHALPVACSFRRQMLFDHQHPCYAGDLGLGVNPRCWRASARPTCCCSWAGACRKCPRRATPCSTSPRRRSRWCMCTPTPMSSAACTRRSCP